MGKLYLANDLRLLADKLADEMDGQAKAGDFFAPVRVVIPNRYMRKWLRLHLARTLGVAINLTFETLETALWNLFREADPSPPATAPESIDDNTYRLLVLSVLLEDSDPNLAPLERFLQRENATLSRLSCRRAWHLADRFGLLIRDYEYARQDALIQRWLKGQFGLPAAGAFHQAMERAQRALFTAITREPNGRRALLNRLGGNNYKTFPQYAMERMLAPERPRRPGAGIHFFGFTEICTLHARAIAWLDQCFPVCVYHLNVLANRIPSPVQAESLLSFVQSFRANSLPDTVDRGWELLHRWGRAGAEALDLVAPLVAAGFDVQTLTPSPRRTSRGGESVLGRLQEQLLGLQSAKARLPQDITVQIVGCPGVVREVQTLHDSIVANLQREPGLRQTDIGVLVTDMSKYRAALQARFERGGELQYNMVDFSAAGSSTFAQAVLGMLDLALESFARSRVFNVLLNPCFLARLEVDRAEAMTWLDWAENLGIYQGWDAEEKAQQGYACSPLYSWRLGLQRLRLGRYMDVTDEIAAGPATRFGDVIPFADVASTDRERLDAFCRAVEGLLPELARLRKSRLSGARWATLLRRMIHEFLDVPADRAEEAQARANLLSGLDTLSNWDHLRDADEHAAGLPLALVREFVHSQFKSLPGNHGEYLIGGVTIAELQPMRPAPFAIVYILGLGEALFPGSNTLSSFDLRGAERLPGDIRPAEARLFDFLTAIASAGKKLYLLYNNRDLQRDQVLLPSAPVLQLKRYLSDQVIDADFQEVAMPLHAEDMDFLDPAEQPVYQDVLVQPDHVDRCTAILDGKRTKRIALSDEQEKEWSRHCQALQMDFAIPGETADAPPRANVVSLRELQRFLRLPATESLRRHLRIEEQYEAALEDDEPLVTSKWAGAELIRRTLQHIILTAVDGGVEAALTDWRDRFAQIYSDARARSHAPEAAFGEIDQAALAGDLAERLHGQGQIETFLHEHASASFCGPVLLGESMMPIGARLRFPALRLRPGEELDASAQEIRVIGSTYLAWHSPGRFEILIIEHKDDIRGDRIELPMIEPFLLYLSLLANAEPNAEAVSSRAWLAPREFLLHVSHQGGIQTWEYPVGCVTPAEAGAYLAQLTRDFLRSDEFDLLPFALLNENLQLRLAFQEATQLQISSDEYRANVCDAIENDREGPFPKARIPLVVDMIQAQVPEDALAKVQRRFRLLDRGPALVRQQPVLRKGRRPAKHE